MSSAEYSLVIRPPLKSTISTLKSSPTVTTATGVDGPLRQLIERLTLKLLFTTCVVSITFAQTVIIQVCTLVSYLLPTFSSKVAKCCHYYSVNFFLDIGHVCCCWLNLFTFYLVRFGDHLQSLFQIPGAPTTESIIPSMHEFVFTPPYVSADQNLVTNVSSTISLSYPSLINTPPM
ncbi:hypothetical protein SADUNF_Sadunf05G0107100 [Salix dunnii]|uniref:Uncharacterized protein n=1 Tax=Salix dunnii TaxID=1413687 RepID=A0A835K7T3_9ROSI|nr:hypothetical protein SADUNF_Sadunf05G0107100 [Salix dunnii]